MFLVTVRMAVRSRARAMLTMLMNEQKEMALINDVTYVAPQSAISSSAAQRRLLASADRIGTECTDAIAAALIDDDADDDDADDDENEE